MTRKKLAIAVGVPALAFAAWLGFTALKNDPPDDARAGPPLALYARDSNTDDGLAVGTLIREGPCLYVQPDPLPTGAPRSRTLLAFAARTAWWIEEEQAIWRHSGTYRVGDRVSFGGGTGSDDDGYGPWHLYEWDVPPDPACDTSRWWMAAE